MFLQTALQNSLNRKFNWVISWFWIYCNIAYRHITCYFCRWWRHLFISKIVNYFQAESFTTLLSVFFFFFGPPPVARNPSTRNFSRNWHIFFLNVAMVLRDFIQFCVTKPKSLGKVSSWKKRPAIVKMAPKQSFFGLFAKMKSLFLSDIAQNESTHDLLIFSKNYMSGENCLSSYG